MEQFMQIYFVILVVLSAVLVINFILAFLNSVRLYFYLLKNKPDQFKRKTSFFDSFGVGASNPFKWFPYIFNDEDFNDERVKILKHKIRPRLKLFAIMFFVITVLLIIDFCFF